MLKSTPHWENTVLIMDKYGIASSDAMILNIFLSSNIHVLFTCDFEMASVAQKESSDNKIIFIPIQLIK